VKSPTAVVLVDLTQLTGTAFSFALQLLLLTIVDASSTTLRLSTPLAAVCLVPLIDCFHQTLHCLLTGIQTAFRHNPVVPAISGRFQVICHLCHLLHPTTAIATPSIEISGWLLATFLLFFNFGLQQAHKHTQNKLKRERKHGGLSAW